MTNSQLFTAAHKLAKGFIGDYQDCFALALKEIRETKEETEITMSLEIAYKNREARKNAKNFGFKWNSIAKLWEKEMKLSEVPYYLEKYIYTKKENTAKKSKMSYHAAYDRFGFDFAEEGSS